MLKWLEEAWLLTLIILHRHIRKDWEPLLGCRHLYMMQRFIRQRYPINAHATSTFAGDLSELKAISTVFSENENLMISATKAMTGHLLGAAGAIESTITILALKHRIIPPTINTKSIELCNASKSEYTDRKRTE